MNLDLIKQIFPLSFGEKKDITALVINILIYFIAGAVAGLVIGLLAGIPIIGFIFGLVGGIVGLYSLVGIVLSCLDYFKILK